MEQFRSHENHAESCDIGSVMFRIPGCSAPLAFLLFTLANVSVAGAQTQQHAYLGMDRNDYPGDANMVALRKTFAFTGYWLNNPPGANRNTWQGKRKTWNPWATVSSCCSTVANMPN